MQKKICKDLIKNHHPQLSKLATQPVVNDYHEDYEISPSPQQISKLLQIILLRLSSSFLNWCSLVVYHDEVIPYAKEI